MGIATEETQAPSTFFPPLPDVTVGTSPVQLTATSTFCRGVLVRSLATNTAGQTVRVGDSTVATNLGIPLAPGEWIYLPVNNASKVWFLATAASQIMACVVFK